MTDDLFEEVKPEDLPDLREGARGRMAYPTIKGFLETGFPVAKLNHRKLDPNRPVNSIKQTLTQYAQKKLLPVKFFTRGGDIYAMRLDIDLDGKPVPNWMKDNYGISPEGDEVDEVKELTDELAAQRAETMKDAAAR